MNGYGCVTIPNKFIIIIKYVSLMLCKCVCWA